MDARIRLDEVSACGDQRVHPSPGYPTLLTDALQIIKICEALVVGDRIEKRRFNWLWQPTRSFEMVRQGVVRFFAPLGWFIAYAVVSCIVVTAIAWLASASKVHADAWRYIASLLSLLLAVFNLPSAYVADGISAASIGSAAEGIAAKLSISEKRVDAVSDTIEELRGRARARIIACQWSLAGAWTVTTFLWAQYTGIAMKIVPVEEVFKEVVQSGMHIIPFGIISILLLLAVLGYKRSVDRVFLLAKHALAEIRLSANSSEALVKS